MKKVLLSLALLSACFVAGAANEVGTYPTAGPLTGSERMLSDQSGVTVDILPSQLVSYFQTSGAIFSLLPSPLINGYCIANNGTALVWQACSATGTVTSVGLSMPSGFTVAGTPITSNGTLAVTTSLSGVVKGSAGGFTTAAASDIIGLFSGCSGTAYLGADGACHNGSSSGTVTSVGLSAPSWLTVTGSPVTTTGTISIAGATGLTTHQVIGTGSAGSLTLEPLTAADLPASITSNTTGNAATATALATTPSQCAAGSFATGIATSGNSNCSTAVTSVGLSTPSWLAVTGSPVTGSGTLALSAASGQAQNSFLATPNGATGPVGLRSIVAADLPSSITSNTTGNAATASALAATPTGCALGQFATGVQANGNANCQTPAGGGNVSTSGSPVANQVALFATGTSISGTMLGNGQLLQGTAGAPTATSSPTLGASGTLGSLTFGNATSGLVTLEPVAGALGTVTATLPANTGQLAELNMAQTWSATQTFGTNISIGGVTPAGATGTGNLVFATGPSLTTPNIGAATGTSLSVSGQLSSTVATGTAPLVVSSTTNVPNLNASSLNGATFATPGPIGSGSPSSGAFTTLSSSGGQTNTKSGAASAPALTLTGNPFTGGSGTTTVPLDYLNQGTAPTTWSTNGTEFGINAPSGFTGNFLDFRVNGGSCVFCVASTGALTLGSPLTPANGGIGTSATPSNGQIPIGTGSGFSLATITAGANITVTNTAGGITIAAPGGTGVTSVTAGSSGDLSISPTTGPVVADLASQANNTVIANVSGSAGAPTAVSLATFQGALVSANAQTVSPTPATGPINDWDPTLLSPPVQSNASTSTTGGSLAAATYFYEITALNARGETTVSNEKSVTTTGSTSSNTITWAAVVGATSYRVYRGTSASGESVYYAPGNVTTYVDTGATSTAGSPPGTNGTGGAILTTAFAYTTPPTGGTTIDGMVAGSNGQQTFITNTEVNGVGTDNITLKNQSSSDSTAANRFSAPGDITVGPGGTADCVYLSVNLRWNCVLVTSGAGTPGAPANSVQTNNGSGGFSGVLLGAGQILQGNAGAPTATATPTLGASGTLGSLTMGNATSGTVTIEPVTGALGSVTASFPANTGTVAELNLNQAWFGQENFQSAGTSSFPSIIKLTGAPYTGGTGTTTQPLFYLNSGATAPTTFSTNGTEEGINAPSGFTGRLYDWYINGTEVGKISTYGNLISLPNAATSATSVTPNCEYAFVKVTASATGTFTVNAPNTCTPVDGQKLELKVISPAGGTVTYAWNATYLASATLALPTTSNASSKEDYFSFQYDADKSGWVFLAANQGF